MKSTKLFIKGCADRIKFYQTGVGRMDMFWVLVAFLAFVFIVLIAYSNS